MPFAWTQDNLSTININKEPYAARASFDLHCKDMFNEYCSEAQQKKVYIINLLKRKGNELRLSEQLEEILKITKEDYARD